MTTVSNVEKGRTMLVKASKRELEVRIPIWAWAMRRTMMGRTQKKMARARRPGRPKGNHAQMTGGMG